MKEALNYKDKKFIKYFKYIKNAKEIIECGNLTNKNILRVNNLYAKADALFVEINSQRSYSTVGVIVGSMIGVALSGGFLYYFGKKYLDDQHIVDLNKINFDKIKNYSLEDLVDIWREKYGDDNNYNDERLNINQVYNYLNQKLNLNLKYNTYTNLEEGSLVHYIDHFYHHPIKFTRNKFTENDLDILINIIKTDNVVDLKKVSSDNFLDKLSDIKQKDNLRKIIIEKSS